MSNQPPPPPGWQPGQPQQPWDQPSQTPPPPAGQWPPNPAQGVPPGQVPYTPMPAQPAPKKKGFNFAGIIALVVIVGLIAGGYWLFRDKISGSVNDLHVGDCFDEPATFTSIKDVQHHPCNEPHDAEVAALLTDATAKGQPYPARDYFRTQLTDKCGPAVSTYIGTDVNVQEVLDFGVFFPNEEGWTSGDRGLTCYVYRIDEAKLSTSVRAGAASPQ